jgi:hypothetical protein
MRYARFTLAFVRNLNREAALDSLKNVLAVLGLGTVLADFSTMRLWFMVPGAVIFFTMWAADYYRHDFSEDEMKRATACFNELNELQPFEWETK